MKKFLYILAGMVVLFCFCHSVAVTNYHPPQNVLLLLVMTAVAAVGIPTCFIAFSSTAHNYKGPEFLRTFFTKWAVWVSLIGSLFFASLQSFVTVPAGEVIVKQDKIYYPQTRVFLLPIKDWMQSPARKGQITFWNLQHPIPGSTNGYMVAINVEVEYDFAQAQRNGANSVQDWPNIQEEVFSNLSFSGKPLEAFGALLNKKHEIDGKMPGTWKLTRLSLYQPQVLTF